MDNQLYINEIIQKVNFRSHILKEIFRFSNYKTKHLISTSIILSTFRYAVPLLIDSTKIQLQSLQTLLLKATRPIIGFQSYKWSTLKILSTLNWPTIHQLITTETIKFFHRKVYENLPKDITKLICISHERSELTISNRAPQIKITSKSEFLIKSVLHRAVYIYSLLPEKNRLLNPKKMNKIILEYVPYNWEPHSIPTLSKLP